MLLLPLQFVDLKVRFLDIFSELQEIDDGLYRSVERVGPRV
jgi:hypothetical protein